MNRSMAPRRRKGVSSRPLRASAALVALGVVCLSGCSEDVTGRATVTNPTVSAVKGHWALASATIDDTEYTFPGNANGPTFHVVKLDGSGQANVGCSIVGTTVRTDGSSFRLGVSGLGAMLGCMFRQEDTTDGAYFKALRAVESAELSDDGLTLLGRTGELHFVPIKVRR